MDDVAVADTGTAGNYLTLDSPWDNKQQAVHTLPTQMSNGEIITSTHTELLFHPDFPLQARKAHTFPGLNKALLFIGILCDHGCEATFNNKYLHILNKQSGQIIMKGTRETRTNLYMSKFTQKNKLMTESTTPDEYFSGSAY